ncbi:hypothetical protein [Sphingomonas panaciterrae]|uniref:hypothetical protein n=1 Tax=Sphingomonas panaciterrae TaxID=1462999 RepID=UPI002FF02D4B
MAVVLEISPLDPTSGMRKPLRVSAHDDSRVTGLNGQRWWPGVVAPPTLRLDGWDGSFASTATLASASAQIDPVALRRLDQRSPAYRWAGAPLRIWQGTPGAAWGEWREIFTGLVNDYGTDENGRYTFSAQVDGEPFEADLLNRRYAGTGAAEGDDSLKDKPKPALFGRARNVEPVQIDAVNLVYQVHGYGPIRGIAALYERAASLIAAGGKNVGDFADYAALVAAAIPEGSFGTCLARGMFRLGAPPAGLVTADVEGDNASGFVRSTAAVITRMCAIAEVDPARIDAGSLAALETAVPYPINLYVTASTTLLQMVQSLAQACNAQAIIDWNGRLRVIRFGAVPPPAITLDAQGRRRPPVLANQEVKVSPPYWRIEMRGARCWRTHGMDEVAFGAPLVPRGDYSATETYREGNIVQHQGSSWLYINTTPGAGHAPPALPATENTHWSKLSSAPAWDDIPDPNGTKPSNNADKTSENTSKDTEAVGGRPVEQVITHLDVNTQAILEEALRQDDLLQVVQAIAYVEGQPVSVKFLAFRNEILTDTSALASDFNGIFARAANGTSRIINLQTVLVDETKTLAEKLEEVGLSEGDVEAKITEYDRVVSGRFGNVEATRTIAIDINGNIVGTQLVGVADGRGSLNLVNADLRMGTGRVIFNNGSVMRVQGTGFGQNNDFISWFGPTMAIEDCSRANAISYEATNGDAYFGGSLSAGVLRNSVQTSSQDFNASVSTGPLGSNGGTRTVVVSYAWTLMQSVDQPQNEGTGATSATIVLSRNGVDVATLTATGIWRRDPAFSAQEPGNYTSNIGGALTFTDNSGGLGVEYSARLTGRNTGPGPQNGSLQTPTISQRISIVQTEE